MTQSFDNFPEFTEDELKDLTMGIYQLKQAKSYTDEHFDEKGSYEIMAHKEDDGVLKAHIRSRHASSKTYNLWVEYTKGLNLITGWYCGCRRGVLCTCGFSALVFRILPQRNRKQRNQTEQDAH